MPTYKAVTQDVMHEINEHRLRVPNMQSVIDDLNGNPTATAVIGEVRNLESELHTRKIVSIELVED